MYLNEWLSYLETLHPHEIELGLERVRAVAEKMQLFPWHIITITVTGTNGKGSTTHGLNEVYLTQGYRVGLYTSPHLINFNERIIINGHEVSDIDLINAFEFIEKTRGNISLTYFEFTTLAALYLFKKNQLDVVILEVGMGGRLDAVNIIDADVSVITNIDIDHAEYLGNTRELIAAEKSGIMRPDHPCVCGDENPPENLLTIAEKTNTKIYLINRDFFVAKHKEKFNFNNNFLTLNDLPKPKIYLNNAALVLQVIFLLDKKLPIEKSTITKVLQNLQIPGRQQLIKYKGQHFLLDVAHNPNACELLAKRLSELNYPNVFAVFSMLQDKDILTCINLLKLYITSWVVAPLAIARASSLEKLKIEFAKANIEKVSYFASITEGLTQLSTNIGKDDLILVFGSFYTVAEAFKLIHSTR